MIILGVRERSLEGPVYEGLACPRCAATRLATRGRQRYLHLYWVPLVAWSRSLAVDCADCGHELERDALPAHLVNRVQPAIFTPGRTLSRFTGAIVLGALALLVLALA